MLYYLGFCLTATAVGMCYTAPIQGLMRWYPNKKGLASGITLAGVTLILLIVIKQL